MLATLCYAARRRTSFNCACYVLKGVRATPVDAAILLVKGVPFDALGCCYTAYVVQMSNVF